MRYALFALVLCRVVGAAPLSAAELFPAAPPLADPAARQALQDRDTPAALPAIQQAIQAADAPRDYLLYLSGAALLHDGQFDRAIEAFDAVAAQFPESPWMRRTRLASALASARKGDFRRAEEIYRAEAEFLLSAGRRQELAEIYLEFADAYFDPPQDDQTPQYAKAYEFYEKALQQGPSPETAARIELRMAIARQETGPRDEAIRLFEQYVAKYPPGPPAEEARYRLGQAQLDEGDRTRARIAWEDLLAAYPESRSEHAALAAFRLAETWQLPEPDSDAALDSGVAALREFLRRFPEHEKAGEAYLNIARALAHRDRFADAAQALQEFLADERYSLRAEAPEAGRLLGDLFRRQKKFPEALQTWRGFLASYPTHAAWSEIQREVIRTEYLMAVEEYRKKNYDEARRLLGEFLAKYPLDPAGPEILELLGQMHYEEKHWDEALAAWQDVVSKHPQSQSAASAQLRIGRMLEEDLHRYEEAIAAYKKVGGAKAADAQQALARLTEKELVVVTERVFRSDETPRLSLTTRNIDKLTLRAYRVDLETYFRKMHLADGLGALDIALIDPDRTWEFTVPDYEPYRKLQSTVEVPMPEEAPVGVLAVTVTGKTREATAMLVRSDLEIVLKTSREEAFVFAQNLRTGQPWGDVRVLWTDGGQVFAEGKTGADGVVRQSLPDLSDAASVRAFAVADAHTASSGAGLAGIQVAQGLEPKGYLYTDRPAYRAGQVVHIRGCIRKVSGDRYVVESGRKCLLEVLDPRDRLLHRQEVTLSEYGTLHDHFVLPATCPQGDYRIRVTGRGDAVEGEVTEEKEEEVGSETQPTGGEGRVYSGSFRVHAEQIEPVTITVDTPRRVYYRGEEIEGTIRVAYDYGAPLASREVRYQLADGRGYTATTDAKGEVAFRLPTRQYAEDQVLRLTVTLSDRGLEETADFLLATQGFSISLSSPRDVYIAGETLEVQATTLDAEGRPLAQALKLKVYEETEVDGTLGERLHAEHDLATGDDGRGRLTLKLDAGGRYTLRAEGTDRFGHPVSGLLALRVSGDGDRQRLHILADAHTFKVGDAARVTLHWRERPALALVAFQGARVLQYQLVELKTGANLLEIPMTADLAPNFDLAVAVMIDPPRAARPEQRDGGGEVEAVPATPFVRFHEAASPFQVQRDLRVALTAKAKGGGPLVPGTEVDVTVTTTDPQGNPLPAELSLAMVERTLLDRFDWPMPAIGEFFAGLPRERAIATTASITFECRAESQAIDSRLLGEEERAAILREEEETRKLLRADGQVVGGQGEGMGGGAGGFGGGMGFGAGMGGMGGPGGGDIRMDIDGSTVPMDELPEDSTVGDDLDPFAAPSSQEPSVHPVADLVIPLPGWLESGGEKLSLNVRQMQVFEGQGRDGLPLDRQETGYWNPAVRTDEQGQATVTFTLPEQTTAWRLVARGITLDTLAGEAEEEVIARKDLFGELKLPPAFTEGDRAEVLAVVHNDAVEQGAIQVTLKTTVDGQMAEETKTVDVSARGLHEVPFSVKLDRPQGENAALGPVEASVRFELTVAAAERTDVVRRAVPLLPYGMPVVAAASGSAESDTTAWLEAPPGMPFQRPWLEVFIGPSVEHSLLDTVLAPAPWCDLFGLHVASDLETTTSDLLAALALKELLSGSQQAGGPEAAALDERTGEAVRWLVSAQSEDGGWSWTGHAEAGNPYSTARAVWALGRARAAAYDVPEATLAGALEFIRGALTAADNADSDTKAVLLHALASAGEGDFALANRLYRDRTSLSSSALAYLALALAAMDRQALAADLLPLIGLDNPDAAQSRRVADVGCLASPVELRALYALALRQILPGDPRTKAQVERLLAERSGSRWSPDRATGPAVLALAGWYGQSRFEGEKYQLTVTVNATPLGVLDIDPSAGTLVVPVPAAALVEGKQQVRFQLTGRGRYTYQCVLSGFVPADALKSTTDAWQVRRTCEPALLEADGNEIPRGFGIVEGEPAVFRNPLTQLPVGRWGRVELEIRRRVAADTPKARLPYLVLTEPVPAGTTVVKSSISGRYERYEIVPGAITFYLGDDEGANTLTYELAGYLPGEYRAAPSVLRDAHRPEQMAVAEAKSLAVLPAGQASADAYRFSPDELLALGKLAKERGDLAESQEHLTELFTQWKLKGDVYRQVVRTLFDIHLELGPAAEIVRYFEIVKERWPDEWVPLEGVLKVAAAYQELGEHERGWLVFRAAIEARFDRETAVAGSLAAEGEFLRSVDTLTRTLRDYPPEPYVAQATYALAQQVYAHAAEAAQDAKLREAKVNRIDLIHQAWRMLEGFLTAWPDDPAADQAAFAAANALLELEQYPQAAEACARYAKRYPQSKLADSFWYVVGFCHFAMGRHDEALATCRKVAETERIDPKTGIRSESPNKWEAVYILGQIHHSLGQAAEAVAEYRRVADRFHDAQRSIDYFTRQAVALPEVTTARPGKPVELELRYRNVASCDVKVYRIDLMKFTLLRQNLGAVTQINLAGIRPQYAESVALGDGNDYRDRTHPLTLPLTEEGAYLVVCRGGDLHASGLALITPLEVEVQHEAESGEVRATVKDVVSSTCASGVHVKVIGSGNAEFVSGETDLRGVLVATGIVGSPTVIAEAPGGRYAFHRSPAAPAAAPAPPVLAALPDIPTPSDTRDWEQAAQIRAAIRKRLEMVVPVEFIEQPLSAVIDDLSKKTRLEFEIDRKALADVGLAPDVPITVSLTGAPLRTALRMMLRELSLTYVIEDNVVLITTPEEAETRLETALYPVTDLVRYKDPSGKIWSDMDSVIQLIMATIKPTSWDAVGGPGSIGPISAPQGDVLVVSQTEEVQEEIMPLLNTLRKKLGMKEGEELPVREQPPGYPGADWQPMGMGGFGGGMGMGGGGYGGMGGMAVGDGEQAFVGSPAGAAPSPRSQLLQGLQDANRANQGEQVQQLQQRYDRGKGGAGLNAGGFY